jgi:hypothetical protein
MNVFLPKDIGTMCEERSSLLSDGGDCFGTPALAGGARENTLAKTN